jgi:hypothetical protein
VEEFLKGTARVKRLDTAEVELSASSLPKEDEVVVLQHAL